MAKVDKELYSPQCSTISHSPSKQPIYVPDTLQIIYLTISTIASLIKTTIKLCIIKIKEPANNNVYIFQVKFLYFIFIFLSMLIFTAYFHSEPPSDRNMAMGLILSYLGRLISLNIPIAMDRWHIYSCTIYPGWQDLTEGQQW